MLALHLNSANNDESSVCSKAALLQDANVKKVISEQTAQWSSMVERQRKEEWEMMKSHTEAGREEFKKLIEVVQASQVKQLQAKHDKYAESLNTYLNISLFRTNLFVQYQLYHIF